VVYIRRKAKKVLCVIQLLVTVTHALMGTVYHIAHGFVMEMKTVLVVKMRQGAVM
jgi:hypothetical protein